MGNSTSPKKIPGKEEFNETIRYFEKEITLCGVTLALGQTVAADDLSDFDEVILATGVTPRLPDIPGIKHTKVLGYLEVIRGAPVGKSVAVIGAGGIGFDISEFSDPQRTIRKPRYSDLHERMGH